MSTSIYYLVYFIRHFFQTVQISAILQNGCVATFRHRLNGKKILEPIRHESIAEILTRNGHRLPILDVVFDGADSLLVAYGDPSLPMFEQLKLDDKEKYIKLIREPLVGKKNSHKDDVDGASKEGPTKFHVAAAIPMSMKSRKRTLGDKLKQQEATREVEASSVLAQGLLSRDQRILDSVLGGPNADNAAKRNSENQQYIEKAIDGLDNALLLSLLDELTVRLATSHPAASQIAARWLSVLLKYRGSVLANSGSRSGANSAVNSKLGFLRDTLVARTEESSRVLQLRGRLRMLREIAKPSAAEGVDNQAAKKQQNANQPFVLSNADCSSSDEDEDEEYDSDSALEVESNSSMQWRKKKSNGRAGADDDADEDDFPEGERSDMDEDMVDVANSREMDAVMEDYQLESDVEEDSLVVSEKASKKHKKNKKKDMEMEIEEEVEKPSSKNKKKKKNKENSAEPEMNGHSVEKKIGKKKKH